MCRSHRRSVSIAYRPLSLSLRIEYTRQPLEVHLRISVARLETGVVPSRSGKCRPIASVSGRWPDYKYDLQRRGMSWVRRSGRRASVPG